ncbi:MAG: malonyl-[acyl-carrier protein] O-methyltransferase BioC [Bacteroidetes bacterium 4572_117]|nr:MAG: malonyl-[acyl-carrier protein] O-methyltransferase BioC [Bacteroidetes bacterium 4572_117]
MKTDKKTIQNRFNNSVKTYNYQAVVQKQIASKLANLISINAITDFNQLLEIGCGTGFLTKQMLNNSYVKEYFLNDLADSVLKEVQHITNNFNFTNFNFISGDAEKTTFPKNIDAIISSSSFQWFNDLEAFILQAQNLLNDNGLLAFSTFGADNFKEIKTTLNVGLHYKTLQELINTLKPNFNILHAEEWRQKEKFKNPNEVLRHIKLTGVNGFKKTFFGKEKLFEFNKKYRQLFSNNGGSVYLTYHPIIIIAKKKSEKTCKLNTPIKTAKINESNRIFY